MFLIISCVIISTSLSEIRDSISANEITAEQRCIKLGQNLHNEIFEVVSDQTVDHYCRALMMEVEHQISQDNMRYVLCSLYVCGLTTASINAMYFATCTF